MNHFENRAAKIDYTLLVGSGSLFVNGPTGHVAIPREDWDRIKRMIERAEGKRRRDVE